MGQVPVMEIEPRPDSAKISRYYGCHNGTDKASAAECVVARCCALLTVVQCIVIPFPGPDLGFWAKWGLLTLCGTLD